MECKNCGSIIEEDGCGDTKDEAQRLFFKVWKVFNERYTSNDEKERLGLENIRLRINGSCPDMSNFPDWKNVLSDIWSDLLRRENLKEKKKR